MGIFRFYFSLAGTPASGRVARAGVLAAGCFFLTFGVGRTGAQSSVECPDSPFPIGSESLLEPQFWALCGQCLDNYPTATVLAPTAGASPTPSPTRTPSVSPTASVTRTPLPTLTPHATLLPFMSPTPGDSPTPDPDAAQEYQWLTLPFQHNHLSWFPGIMPPAGFDVIGFKTEVHFDGYPFGAFPAGAKFYVVGAGAVEETRFGFEMFYTGVGDEECSGCAGFYEIPSANFCADSENYVGENDYACDFQGSGYFVNHQGALKLVNGVEYGDGYGVDIAFFYTDGDSFLEGVLRDLGLSSQYPDGQIRLYLLTVPQGGSLGGPTNTPTPLVSPTLPPTVTPSPTTSGGDWTKTFDFSTQNSYGFYVSETGCPGEYRGQFGSGSWAANGEPCGYDHSELDLYKDFDFVGHVTRLDVTLSADVGDSDFCPFAFAESCTELPSEVLSADLISFDVNRTTDAFRLYWSVLGAHNLVVHKFKFVGDGACPFSSGCDAGELPPTWTPTSSFTPLPTSTPLATNTPKPSFTPLAVSLTPSSTPQAGEGGYCSDWRYSRSPTPSPTLTLVASWTPSSTSSPTATRTPQFTATAFRQNQTSTALARTSTHLPASTATSIIATYLFDRTSTGTAALAFTATSYAAGTSTAVAGTSAAGDTATAAPTATAAAAQSATVFYATPSNVFKATLDYSSTQIAQISGGNPSQFGTLPPPENWLCFGACEGVENGAGVNDIWESSGVPDGIVTNFPTFRLNFSLDIRSGGCYVIIPHRQVGSLSIRQVEFCVRWLAFPSLSLLGVTFPLDFVSLVPVVVLYRLLFKLGSS